MERFDSGWKVFAQNRSELVGDLLALPCGVLAGAGKHGDGLCEFGVSRKWPVGVGIGAQDVGQHRRIGMVRLRPRHAVALAVARYSQRIDRIHGSAGGSQACHQKTAAGFDRNRYRLIGRVTMLGEQFEQHPKTGGVVTDASLRDRLAAIVDDTMSHVVLRPIDPTKRVQGIPFLRDPRRTVLGQRRTNGRTRRSDTRSAVHVPSKPRGLSLHISGLLAARCQKRSVPAAGSTHQY